MNSPYITGVILAGGLARRMNGKDKGLIMYKNQPLIRYAIDALAPVVQQLWLNANRNHALYTALGYQVIADHSKTFDGPLAGILAALTVSHAGILVVMPCDCPFIKTVHLQKLVTSLLSSDSDLAVAVDGEFLHPVFLALKTTLQPSIAAYLANGERKMATWIMQQRVTTVDFSHARHIFLNINTVEQLATLE